MELVGKTKAEQLPCWEEQVIATPLTGGITNTNFKIHYRGDDFVVRIGVDIPEHGIMRFNELNASTAAYKAGISPEIIYQSPGALVMRYIDGTTLTPEMVLLGTAPEERDRHLQVLASLARTVGADRAFQDQLFESKSSAHAYELLHGEESEAFNYFMDDALIDDTPTQP